MTSEPLNVSLEPLIFREPVSPIALARGTMDACVALADLKISEPDNSLTNFDIGLFYSSIML